MGKHTKIIPFSKALKENKEDSCSIVDALIRALSCIDKELEQHLNSEDNKPTIK